MKTLNDIRKEIDEIARQKSKTYNQTISYLLSLNTPERKEWILANLMYRMAIVSNTNDYLRLLNEYKKIIEVDNSDTPDKQNI